MENLIRVTFLASILSVVVVGCGGGHKSETAVSQQTAEDTVVATLVVCRQKLIPANSGM